MFDASALPQSFVQHGPIWFVTIMLVVAAVIDGYQLRVPNWLTFPMIVGGWAFCAWTGGWDGLTWSLIGALVGLCLLLPAYAIGGMGAGDVKLLAGVGAWVGGMVTLRAFCVSAVLGGVIAVAMVLARGAWAKHREQFWRILDEVLTIRNPERLSTIAARRKETMLLLPYGIPIAIGSIAYFAWSGMLSLG